MKSDLIVLIFLIIIVIGLAYFIKSIDDQRHKKRRK